LLKTLEYKDLIDHVSGKGDLVIVEYECFDVDYVDHSLEILNFIMGAV
jgi:hypothetical protein